MRVALVALLALSVPLLLASTNVRLMALSPALYEWGFRRHRVDQTTGLDAAQLRQIAEAFIRYFQSPPGRMDIRVRMSDQEAPLLNEREIQHMVDVQALIRALGAIQISSAATLAVVLVLLGLLERRPLGWSAGLGLALGAGLTALALAAIGLGAALDFSSLWTRFHLVAFTNDLWLLDPARDNLIRLFPVGFWLDATLLLAGLTAVEALLVALVGWAGMRAGASP